MHTTPLFPAGRSAVNTFSPWQWLPLLAEKCASNLVGLDIRGNAPAVPQTLALLTRLTSLKLAGALQVCAAAWAAACSSP